MSSISISKAKIEKESGVVILPVREYRRLLAAMEDLKPVDDGLRKGYARMAADRARERQAREWSEATIHDAYGAKGR